MKRSSEEEWGMGIRRGVSEERGRERDGKITKNGVIASTLEEGPHAITSYWRRNTHSIVNLAPALRCQRRAE